MACDHQTSSSLGILQQSASLFFSGVIIRIIFHIAGFLQPSVAQFTPLVGK